MASIKMQKFEKEMLAFTGELKQLVHENIQDAEVKQKFLISINNLFDRGHLEARKLRKALAFLHKRLEEAGIDSSAPMDDDSFKLGEVAGDGTKTSGTQVTG